MSARAAAAPVGSTFISLSRGVGAVNPANWKRRVRAPARQRSGNGVGRREGLQLDCEAREESRIEVRASEAAAGAGRCC